MDDLVIPDFNRQATVETVIPTQQPPPLPPPPVRVAEPVVYAPPPRVVVQPTPMKDTGFTVAPEEIQLLTVPNPVASTNLAPDISTFSSSNEPYFQLASEVQPTPLPDTWYEFPSLTGSVLFDNTIPNGPLPVQVGTLHAFGQTISYQNQSLMPATWYLNPALNGEVLLDDASGTQLLHSIDGNLYYNNELLAKANDIQDIADWSLYPSLAPVDFNNFGINNLGNVDASGSTITAGTINFNDLSGGSITSGSINAGNSGIICGGLSTAGVGPTTSNSITTGQILFDISGGTLASPGGTVLTFNGQAITTGTEGDAANWANYPAINTVSGLSTQPLALQAGAGQQITLAAPDNSITATTGGAYNVTVDKGTNILAAANVDITAQNGSGGNIALNAQPGFQLGTQQIGFGAIQLNAYGSSNQALGLGGKIDINAYSGGLGEYGSATSRVSVSSATIALSAGAVPTFPGTAGAMNIFGQDIVSIVASPFPPLLGQFPFSVFLYGDGIPFVSGGVRLQSPAGVQITGNSDFFATDVYPFTSLGLNLKGRAAVPGPAADVTIADCATFAMRNAGTMTGIQSITMAGTGAINDVLTIKPPLASGVGTPNLLISGNPLPLLGFNNFVNIQNAGTIAFDVSGAGALTGVQTVNGVVYPPPLPPIGDVADWATFPAIQNVDISGYVINNVGSINLLTNSAITSAGSLSIFSDGADLALAASNGGNVQIGTGNAGDINIQTSGAGNDLSLNGDTANLVAQAALNISCGAGNTTIDGTDIVITGSSDFTASATTGSAGINGQIDVSLYAATGNVNLVADSGEVIVQDSVLNMNTHKITNLVAGTANTDAVNFQQLTTVVTSKDSTEFYVSDNGSDVSGNGSFFAPYQTIQAAITAAELVASNINVCVINVASGHYNENLTFTKGYVVLNGSLSSQTGNEVCEITGSISIALTGTNDVFNRQVAFNGFNITTGPGQAVTDTSTSSHTVSFQDCKVFAYQQFFVSTATCPDMRFYITNVEVQQTYLLSTFPVIVTNVGQAEYERLDLVLTGNGQGIVVGGTSIMARLSLSTLTSTNPSATLAALLAFTTNTTTSHSIGSTAFAFTSTTAKTNTDAIFINTGVNTAIIFLNNVFTLTGTASSTNFCIGYDGSGSPTIAGFANTSLNVNVLLPQTTAVETGITQIQYTNIQPPGLATYSSTADQAIAVTGTPQALTYNTTQFNQGTTLAASSRVYANAQGNYAINYIVQLSNTAGAAHDATTFLKKNGTTIANTGSQWTIDNAHQMAVAKENIVALNAGDYVEVFFNATATGVSANATAAAGALPAIPSVVFNIKQFR